MKSVKLMRLAVFLFVMLIASTHYALSLDVIPAERIEYDQPAGNGKSLDVDYFIELTSNALRVHSELSFYAVAGASYPMIETIKPVWKQYIETFWNDKFQILKNNELVIPIVIDVAFEGPVFNHYVGVKSTNPNQDYSDLWDINAPDYAIAHEFGHLFGLFDEYHGGGTDPAGAIFDPTSIMAGAPSGGAYPRHFENFREWLADKDPSDQYSIIGVNDSIPDPEPAPVPEPQTIVTFAMGAMMVGIALYRQRSS